MKPVLQPYRFTPILKHVLWGGNRIARLKGSDDMAANDVGESWEISGLEGHETIVAEGPDAGLTLSQLIALHGEQLVGRKLLSHYGTRFPLLFKFIDARLDLSVQVHPGDEMAQRLHGASGKTEMWYVIDAEPKSHIVAGLQRDLTRTELATMLASPTLMDVVAHYDSHAGDVYFLPPGCIHSIGGGNLLAEIQQSSDVTYRVYDFERRDHNGNLRELHTDLALDALNGQAGEPALRMRAGDITDATMVQLASCDYFEVSRLRVNGEMTLPLNDDVCVVLMCVDGHCTLTMPHTPQDNALELSRGSSLLLPAVTPAIIIAGDATLLVTTPR